MNHVLTTADNLVAFRLGPEIYAVDVAHAREIIEPTAMMAMPNAPSWVRGVVNLRGAVLPVVDLRDKLGMGKTEWSRDTCVIVVDLELDGEPTSLGILADAVLEVFELPRGALEPAPNFGGRVPTDVIRGVGHRGNGIFIVLEPKRLFERDRVLKGNGEHGAESAAVLAGEAS